MFIFSDGRPSLDEHDLEEVLREDLRVAIKEIENEGIETVSIGIRTNEIADLYKESVVVHNLKDLAKEALAKLKKMLLKN